MTQHHIKGNFDNNAMCSRFPLIKKFSVPVSCSACQWGEQVFIRFLLRVQSQKVMNKTVLATGRVMAETPLLSLLSLGLLVPHLLTGVG